jgi:multidrug resistance efflux pump
VIEANRAAARADLAQADLDLTRVRDLVKRKYSNGPIVQDLVAFYTSLLKA